MRRVRLSNLFHSVGAAKLKDLSKNVLEQFLLSGGITNNKSSLAERVFVELINNKYYTCIAHTEPLCKLLNILKALWKLYYKLTYKLKDNCRHILILCYQSYQIYAIITVFAFPHFIFH